MKSIMRKAAAYGLVLAMGCTSLAGCGKNGAKIDGSKTLMTVNGEDLRMGVASFYTRFQQAQMYQFYSMYFGSGASIFDTVEDEATGKTYGDDIKEEALNELKKLVTINQHADEYGVSLTDEQKANITAAAEAYIASNDQTALDKVGAAKEDVEKLLTLQTVQSLMMDPIVKDVDREVPDEDAQQTTLTYVAVNVAEDETSETSEAEAQSEAATSEAAASEAATSEAATSEAATSEATTESEAAVSETAAVESEAVASETAAVESEAAASETAAVESEAAASETAAVESEAATSESKAAESEEEETEAQQAARADAEAILEAVMAESMIAEADMDAIARTVDDTYYAATGQFTTNDPADADVDSSVAEAAAGLEDGELVDHVVKSADGTRYYVVRVDHVFDEEATAEKKKSIIEERKQTLYDETTDGWVESADIKVDENVWKTLTLTDMEPVTLKAPEVQSEAESAVSEQETAESTVSSAAAAAESTVSSAAETAESTVSSAAAAAESTVSSAAEAADSAVTSAVETAESTVASVAAAVDSAAESAAGTAAAVESKVEAAAEELESTVEGLESAAETVVNEYEDAVASTVQEAAAEAVSVAEAVENTVTSTVSAAEAAVSQAAETANTAAASSGKTNAAAEAAAAAAAAAAADLSGSAAK